VRFFKILSITVLTLFVILTIAYNARLLVINNLILPNVEKEQPNIEQIQITCLDINLTNDMSIVISQLCIESTIADIEINDMKIQWQYSPQMQITDIDIRLADIKGKAHLFSNVNTTPPSNQHTQNNQSLSQILSIALQPYVAQISQLKLPTRINITEIYYLPFTTKSIASKSKVITYQKPEAPYTAKLSTIDNIYSFSLQNNEKTEFFNAKLAQNKDSFTIELSNNLNLLKNFAVIHPLPITTLLQNDLIANEVNGNVELLIKYQAGVISLQSKINELLIDFPNGINQSSPFKLSGALNFNSHFTLISTEETKSKITDKNNTEITLDFVDKNEILLEYNQLLIINALENNQLPPAIISIVKDNPLKYLKFMTKGNGAITLNDLKGSISHIEISAHDNELIHQTKLDNITFALASAHNATNSVSNKKNKIQHIQQMPYTLAVEHFVIDSQLNLASITKLTKAPVVFHLEGEVDTTDQKTTVSLTEMSSIKFKDIAVTTSDEKKAKTAISLKLLTTSLSGKIQLLKNNDFNINLAVYNKASQVNIPKTLKIKSLNLLSQIQGNLDDISINTTVNADDIYLGDITISGLIQTPRLKVTAKKLQLTDLLSLNIQLPTSVALIDGTLDYSLSGELTDLNNIENTPLNASFSITSLSGEVDGIWVQELNWQESFTLQAGKISTKPHVDNNLTIELIETFTPISKISMNTDWAFNKDFTFSANKLNADIFSGSVSVPIIKWPFEHGHSANVQLNSIDLAQVLALDKKQGIVVTGNISGELPIVFDGEKYMIEQGELHNVSNGLIQVINNPAVESLKANNDQLQFAFEALQNLHYHQLSSEVSMTNDGYMQLDTVIKGRNPTIDNDVNLNLNISYDLLGLLESLSITQHFEDSLIKGLQKNKE